MSIGGATGRVMRHKSWAAGGQAKAAATAKQPKVDIVTQDWHNSTDAVAVFLAEMQAHGAIDTACTRSELPKVRIAQWRKRFADFDQQVQLAVQFSKSGAVDYRQWLAEQAEAAGQAEVVP